MTFPQTLGAVAAGIACTALFFRECQQRSRQLYRLEKELKALSLQIRLPTSLLADQPFENSASIRELQRASGIRVLALTGTASQLEEALEELQVLGRRLTQANAFVVVVSSDGSTRKDWGLHETERLTWLAEPGNCDEWRQYFDDLSKNSAEFKWFGLSSSGRSFGSGRGASAVWLQLLGQHLRPTVILDDSDGSSQDDKMGVMERQSLFYKALTEGNVSDMASVCAKQEAEEVSKVILAGGRLDTWDSCLMEGNRPAGMKVADADITIVSDKVAYSTIIEFPANIDGATLLAVQQWIKENGEWKLTKHQTIPWTDLSAAGGTLICDCRGCVSLTRGPDRRTFGGLIG